MAYAQLREMCYFKTGRDGVVVEFLDETKPNLFENNKSITNSIFKKYSSFKLTLVDARKTQGKGIAQYYNIGPEDAMLLSHLLSDGDSTEFMRRVGAFNCLKQVEQVAAKNIVGTFDAIDHTRFDRVIRKNESNKGTSITLQKNSNPSGNLLNVRRLIISFEEAMNSASKWKLTVEVGTALKDPKGNGLNVVVPGSYKSISKAYVMLQSEEIVIPINEAAKRVLLSQVSYYQMMKSAELDFTRRKIEAKDYSGDKIDEWNPQGIVSQKTQADISQAEPAPSTPKPLEKEKPAAKVDIAPSANLKCADCSAVIVASVKSYSEKVYKKPLCINCQKKNTKVS